MDRNGLARLAEALAHSRCRGRASAGAAGHRNPATALPYAHTKLLRACNFHELDVDASREGLMALHERAYRIDWRCFGIVHEGHGMGVAHRDGRKLKLLAAYVQGKRTLHFHLAHSDADRHDNVVLNLQVKVLDARKRLDIERSLGGIRLIKNVLTHTADAVAAHLGLGSIGIEDPHLEIRHP